jgi:putative cell wall-binding protein
MHRSVLRVARGVSLAVMCGAAGAMFVAPAVSADVRVSPNQRVTSDPSSFRGKDQVSLAVNPANPDHVVAVNVDFLDEFCEASASFNGGSTWSPAAELQPPAPGVGNPFLPSCRVSNHAGESMFQGVQFGTGLNVYAISITPRSAGGTEEGATAIVYKSTDGGVTWGQGVIALPGGTGGNVATGPYYELPVVLVDPGQGTGGADLVYAIARDASGSGNSGSPCLVTAGTRCDAVRLAKSLDGGATFGAPVQVSPALEPTVDAATAAIGPDHSVNVAWRTAGIPGTGTSPSPAEIHFTRSTNQGATFSAPVVVTGVSNLARSSANHTTPLASTASTFPRMDVNKTNGNLYLVYNQGGNGPTAPAGGYQGTDHFIPPDSGVYFQRSLNNGAAWSPPKKISNLSTSQAIEGTWVHQTRHPDVSVAPNGRVDVVWQDRRHWYMGPGDRVCVHTHVFCEDIRLGDTYLASSTDNGATFGANRRVSDHSFNNDVGFDYRFATYWAFGPQAEPMGNDKLIVGWMDSREGSYDSDNQDVYVAKVDFAAGGAVPQASTDQTDPVALSVALSKRHYPGGGEGAMLSGFATRNATNVVIVNRDDPATAIAASVLARANNSPLLLSPAGGLTADVKAEISRLAPAGAIVVGDASALSAQVAADAAAASGGNFAAGDVVRISALDSATLAAGMATVMDKRSAAEKAADAPAFDAVVIANPAGPDAAAATGLAAARRLPILFVSTNAIPAPTASALSSLDINRAIVIGDTSQVSSAVRSSLPTSTRLAGTNQYGTSQEVVDESVRRGLPTNMVYVANGTRPMDAALLGAGVGRSTGIMVLSPGPTNTTAASTLADTGLKGVDRMVLVNGAVAPGVTPPPPPAIVPPPPPPPGAAIVRKKGKLSSRATPTRDTKAPYTFRIRGTLTRPSGVTRAQGCTGRVSVQWKRGNTTISTRRVNLTRTCTYSVKVTFRSKQRFASFKRLKFTARFLGNTYISPVSASSKFVRVRR